MSEDGERNFLPIVAIIIVVIFAGALTAGAVVWRRQHLADTEARAPSSPVATTEAPPPPTYSGGSIGVSPETVPSTTVARPSGSVDIATTSTSIPNAERTLAKLRPGFRACYNKGLTKDPSLHGSITLAIVVAPNGDITSVTKKSGGIDTDVDTCLIRRARNADFDPSPSGATLDVPITFVTQR